MPQPRPCALAAVVVVAALVGPGAARAAPQSFGPGSLIIPMDQAYQDRGMLQAYGLLFQLLRQGVPVQWVIDPDKTWHAAPCNTPGDLCAWDCAVEGTGVKCAYPTASPDFFAASTIRWDSGGASAGTTIANHGYRGGPFVIDAAHHDAAMAIIDAWNDQARWPANPWAQRAIFQVVSVHEASAAFTGNVSRPLVAAPTIAVFSDGNEDIATGYLRAAGLKQSNGSEFPAGRCGGAGTCGPGSPNPDMLTVPSVAGDMGTCGAPSSDHENGALFTSDGLPAYCQIMSMHWNVTDRETVECGGGNCPATQAQCAPATPITYHGHEVVAEVRSFLAYPTHFFAECQAVNAYENTVPVSAWPFLDDAGRNGHFLTTTGNPPACPCSEPGFTCVTGGCNGADCCLPQDVRERGAGFLIAARPSAYKVFHPEVPYNQLDGAYQPIGGSEPAYNLSTYLGTHYQNDQQVTLLSGPSGPGVEDLWMTGYLDGTCDITEPPIPFARAPGDACSGKISYLGGHAFSTQVPMSGHADAQGARLFLNALFEADCVTTVGQPELTLTVAPIDVAAPTVPATVELTATFSNGGAGAALDAALREQVGANATLVDAAGGTIAGDTATWTIGSISGSPARAGDPPPSGTRTSRVSFAAHGDYTILLALDYRVGASIRTVTATATVHVRSMLPGGDGGAGGDGGGGGDGDPSGGCCGASGGASSVGLGALALGLLRRRRAQPR